jgi:ketosteroid isomerase-like protein
MLGMQTRSWALAVLVLAAGPSGCRRGFTASDRGVVEAVLAEQQAAWNRGDLPGYMEAYARTSGLVFTSGGKIRSGWDQTLAAYQKRYGAEKAGMGHLTFDILGVQAVGSDGAVVLGRWRLTETPQAGAGLFSVVLERRPEGWRIIHDHTSSDG